MIPRGRLDIPAADLWWALSACCGAKGPHGPSVKLHWPAWHVVTAMSVRTAWDAWLAEQRWPHGDEVLVSSVTIPDMLQIVREHGLVPVPVPVNLESLSVAPSELEQRITPKTRAAIVAHLFGSRMPTGPLAEVCHRHDIPLIEDAAQSFACAGSFEKSESDAVFLSFGPIKTCTALGGAVLLLRDGEMAGRIERRLSAYPRQPTREYFFRVLKMSLLQALTWQPLFTALCTVMAACRFDWDRLLASLTRGFAGERFWERLRRQPSHPLLGLLERRLASYSTQSVLDRARRANLLWDLLGAVERPGSAASDHTHWVLPIVAPEPAQLVIELRQLGYDATVLASSLTQNSGESCLEDDRWNRLVYLPNHPAAEPTKLAAAIRATSMPEIGIAST